MSNNEVLNDVANEEKEVDPRMKQYKNLAKHEDMRRRRTECSVELRKQKRDDLMMKRRNLTEDEDDDDSLEKIESVEGTTNTPVIPRLTLAEVLEALQNNPSLEKTRDCFESVRRLLSKSKNPPVDEVLECGLVHALVQGLAVDDTKIRFEAAWALTNIVSGTAEQTMKAVEAGATAPLVALTMHPDPALAEQALWAVANIAGDSAQLRDHVIECKGVEALMILAARVPELSPTFVRTLAWAFSNMCRHKNPNAPYEVLKTLSGGLRSLMASEDRLARQDGCWAVSYLTDGPDEQIMLAKEAGVLPIVAQMLQEEEGLVAPALRVLGNVATGCDELTQTVVDLGILNVIPSVARRAKGSSIVKECCWLISNVIAGTQNQIQAVLDAGLLSMLLHVLSTGDHKCQFEASWALANLAQGGTASQMLELLSEKPVEKLCGALSSNQNADYLKNILEVIYGLLSSVAAQRPDKLDMIREEFEEYDGLDKLEALQNHSNEHIYAASFKIVSEFFCDEDEEGANENAVPSNSDISYNF